MNTQTHLINVNENITISSLWTLPDAYQAILIIAHGAGNDMLSPFISFLHTTIAEQGIMTVKFNFPYKEKGRKAPDRPPVLEACWQAVLDQVLEKTRCRPGQVFVSGKSMGGRYASMLATRNSQLGGLILYGYPLHAPGKTDCLRSEHLPQIDCPMLFFQGTRDNLCKLDKLKPLLTDLKTATELHIIEGGDHSFKVLKKLQRSEQEVWREIADHSVAWLKQRCHFL